jgi:hypothetical protein
VEQFHATPLFDYLVRLGDGRRYTGLRGWMRGEDADSGAGFDQGRPVGAKGRIARNGIPAVGRG